MRLKAEASLERRGLLLDAPSVRQLKELRVETDASSDSEVVRHALRIYERLVRDDLEGKSFIIRSRNAEDYVLPDIASAPDEKDALEEPTERRNLMLSERSASRLDRLKKDINATTDSAVVRQALMVYELLVKNSMSGNKLITRDRRGRECEIMVDPGCCEKEDARKPARIFDKLRTLNFG